MSIRLAHISLCILLSAAVHAHGEEREWHLSPVVRPEFPQVRATGWARNGLDLFIQQRLEERGLEPSAEATPTQLIRRLYFDLLGVPPTPGEVASFLADDSPQAYETLVDRLLQDPRYGERWGRLWLDLARYADTAGYEGDPDLPHAWRYRDYVIDSLNRDKPYDRFIKEQLAGDEFNEVMGAGDLPPTPAEHTVALTFLRLAPFTEPRGDETRHELLSEMTSTVSSVFLGLTVGCAKCHDHKYDDIPTRDFYRLKAFFATVSIPRPEPGDGFQIGGPLPAEFFRFGEVEWAAEQRAQVDQQRVAARKELAELKRSLQQRVESRAGFGLQSMGGGLGNDYIFHRERANSGQVRLAVITCDGEKWEFHDATSGPGDTGRVAGSNHGNWYGDLPQPSHISLGQYAPGTPSPEGATHTGHFAEILIYGRSFQRNDLQAIRTYFDEKYRQQQDASPPDSDLRFRLDAADLDANPANLNPKVGTTVSQWRDLVSGITLTQEDDELQPVLEQLPNSARVGVRFEKDFLVGPAGGGKFLSDQTGTLVVVYTAEHDHEGYGFSVGGDGAFLSTFINPTAGSTNLDALLADESNSDVSAEERSRFRWLSNREPFLQRQLKRLQPQAMSLRHSYGPPYEPGVPTSRIMIRGEYDNPGEEVVPGFPTCITGTEQPADIRLDPFKRWPTRSRRMALANWIASPSNPLTGRVLVNRLWHWHFGRGIVTTPSDFGMLGGGPTHPKLLDWLADEFMAGGWNLKAVQRLIVNSATYRQTSLRQDSRAKELDPANALLWRFRRRRLEAEAIRDAILAVSGRLNLEQYGLPVFPPLPDAIAERVKYTTSKWDTQSGSEGRRRSIYIYQQRTLTMPHLQVFDSLVCDESRPRRQTSVTPLQALAMYNGVLVNTEVEHFAARVERWSPPGAVGQVTAAFQIALGRKPDREELAGLVKLHANGGLEAVCRVILNANEFIYVD